MAAIDYLRLYSKSAILEPAKVWVCVSDTVSIIAKTPESAVVDDLSILVTPWRIFYLASGKSGQVSGDDLIDESMSFRAKHIIFEEGGDIDQTGYVPYGVVLSLVTGLKGPGSHVS
jgi:hypothetical protein